jgi:TonB family protein
MVSAPAETFEYLIRSKPGTKSSPRESQRQMKHPDDNFRVSRMTTDPVEIPGVRPQALGVAGNLTPGSPAALSIVATKVPESVPVIPAKAPQTDLVPRAARKAGLFQAAQMIVGINPTYPTSARQDGISGSVELHFTIGTDGTVRDILAVRGPAVLAQAAMEAVGNRKYKPALVDGVPSESEASAIFDFKLN